MIVFLSFLVAQKCYATDQIPQTRIEVMPGEATCSSNPIVKEVAHLVQLGAVCDSGSRVWNGDSSFECGIDNDFTVIGNKFTCKESLTFLAGSQSSIATNLITIPMVEMYSDPASWDSSEMSNCYGEARAFDGGTNADVTNAPTPEGTDPCESPGAGGFGGINIGLPGFGSDDCDTKAPSTPASPTTPATSPPTSTPSPITPMTSPPTDASTPTDDSSKEPDEFTRYKTSYSTKFSHVLEEGCEGPAPMVIAFCFSGSLENIEVSDPSIVCMGPYLTDNGTAYARCSNTCIEEECESVYLNDGTNSDLWGEVTWDCIGNNVEDVHGAVFIPGSDTGTCDGFGDASPDYMGYNFMIAKLGMLCRPDDVAATDNFTNAEYLYDDRHAECMIPAIPSGSMDEYSCLSGRACQTNACTVTIEDIIIEADYYRFPQCIQTSDGSILPELPLPTSEPRATGTYSAVFSVNVQVELSMFYDEDDCTAHARGLKVSCLNGAITLYGSPEFMYCSKNGTSDVECIEKNETTPFNKWGSVVYVSIF